MTLDTPMDVSYSAAEKATAREKDNRYAEAALEDRSAQRIRLRIPATLRPSASAGFHVTVHDLSLSGFLAEAFTCQPVGSRIWLTIPGLAPLQAEIARNDGTIVGCAFKDLLNQAVLDNLVARYRMDE